MKRREFSRELKAQMIRRAWDKVRECVACEGCGLDLTGKDIDFHHVIPEAMFLDKARKLTADDGKVLGAACCHRGKDSQTSRDQGDIAQAKNREAKHFGFASSERPYAGKMQNRGFVKGGKQAKASTPLGKDLPPRINPFTREAVR